MNTNILKKLTASLIVVFLIIYLFFPLQFVLAINDYKITNYDVYKTIGHPSYKVVQILKVYTRDGNFNYIKVAKNAFGYWSLLSEGIPSTKDKNYATFDWTEIDVEVTDGDFDIHIYTHKIFEIRKEDRRIKFSFERLPKDISYTFMENDHFYTIEIYSMRVKAFTDPLTVDINTFTGFSNY